MNGTIIHRPDRRQIDLRRDLNRESTFRWLEGLIGSKCGRTDSVLMCGTCEGLVYLRRLAGHADSLEAVHHQKDGCADIVLRRATPMSDEHKNGIEYLVRAAEAAGLSAETEVHTSARTRVDVVIRGDQNTGYEVQHSHLSVQDARNRTRRSIASGTVRQIAWQSDRTDPTFLGRVPTYRPTAEVNWSPLPPPRSARTNDVYRVDILRCEHMPSGRCPDSRRFPCGRWHLHAEQRWRGFTIDEVAVGLPTGRFVIRQVGKFVRIVTPQDADRYLAFTGQSLPLYDPGKPVRDFRRIDGFLPCYRTPLGAVLPMSHYAAQRPCPLCYDLVLAAATARGHAFYLEPVPTPDGPWTVIAYMNGSVRVACERSGISHHQPHRCGQIPRGYGV